MYTTYNVHPTLLPHFKIISEDYTLYTTGMSSFYKADIGFESDKQDIKFISKHAKAEVDMIEHGLIDML